MRFSQLNSLVLGIFVYLCTVFRMRHDILFAQLSGRTGTSQEIYEQSNIR